MSAKHEAKEENIHFRTTRRLKERAEKLAEQHGRSLTNYLEWLIKQQPLTDEGKRK